jgi:prohibitin 2
MTSIIKSKKGQSFDINGQQILFGAIIVVVAIVAMVILFGSWYSVPKGYVGVLFDRTSGTYTTIGQGWGFKKPIIQDVTLFPFQTQTLGFYGSSAEGGNGQYGAITPKDKTGISFDIDVTVRYHLEPTQAAAFLEQKGLGIEAMESVIVTATRSEAVRGVLGNQNQEDIPSKLGELSADILVALQQRIDKEASGKLKPGYLVIESVDLRNIVYNPAIEKKIEEKQAAKQEAEKQQYVLQNAEYQMKIELTNADRDKQAAILRADGEGQAILLVATAKAKGISLVNTAYQNMPMTYVLTQAYDAIKPTDKIIIGIDSLAKEGNNIGLLNYNQLIGPLSTQGYTNGTG